MSDRKVIARGAVMVDPRAAIARLRDFQLRDPRFYVLELVRAAVAGEATAVSIDNTSRDFVLDAHGPPPTEQDLSRVLDFLLSNADRRLRLIAVAVNTALGLRPDHVDLYTTLRADGADGVARIRWKPASRSARSDDASIFEPASVTLMPRPAAMPSPGLRVHVREAFGWGVVREWATVPAEAALLVARCTELSVPLTLRGAPLSVAPRPDAIAAVELREGTGDDVVSLALTLLRPDTRLAQNTVVFSELGVDLSSATLCTSREDSPAALSLRVRAAALPTNNARDRVSLDGAFGRTLARLWNRALLDLLAAPIARLPSAPDDIADAICEALATLWLVPDEGSEPAVGRISPEVRQVLREAPMFVSPAGARVAIAAIGRPGGPVGSLRSETPLAPEITRWIEPLVWLRKRDRVRTIVAELLRLRDRRDAVDAAVAVRARFVRFQSQPAGDPELATQPGAELLRARFATDDADGVIVARRPQNGRPGALRVRAYYDRRPFGLDPIEPAILEVDAAFGGPGLSPQPDFEGVLRDAGFARAVCAMRGAFIEAVAASCAKDPSSAAATLLARQALAWLTLPSTVAHGTAADRLLALPALSAMRVWPTTSGVPVSTDAVLVMAHSRLNAVADASASARGERTDGRPVLALSAAERAVLSQFVPSRVRWVDPGPWLARRPGALRSLCRNELTARAAGWMTFEGSTVHGEAAALMGRGELLLAHNGHLAETRTHIGRLGSLVVILEDPALLPSPSGITALEESLSDEARRMISEVEGELVVTLARALLGERAALRRVSIDPGEVPPAVARLLLSALGALRSALGVEFGTRERITGAALAALLEDVALVPVCTAPDVLTLRSVRSLRARKGPLPVLRAMPAEVDLEDFDPLVIVDRELERLVALALDHPLEDGTPSLPARRQARARRLAREQFVKRPTLDPKELPDPVIARHDVAFSHGAIGAVGLPAPGVEARVEVLCERRWMFTLPAAELEFPVLARVDVGDVSRFTPTMGGLSAVGRAMLDELIVSAVGTIVAGIVVTGLRGEDCGDAGRALLMRWIAHGSKKKSQQTSLREMFGGLKVWISGGGGRITVREAVHDGRILFARAPQGAWEPRREGEPAEMTVVLVPPKEPLEVWARSLQVLSGAMARDMTEVVDRIQRARRLQQRRGADVKLPGRPALPALATRIERHDSSLGVGELRLIDGEPGVALTVFIDGRKTREWVVPAQIACACALESPWIEPDEIAGSIERAGLVARLIAVARTLMNEVFTAADDEVGELPAWVGPMLRWHVLTSATEQLPQEARSAPLFRDSEGRAMALDDVLREQMQHRAVAFSASAPPRPIAPLGTDRRVLILGPYEVRWLRAAVSVLDYTDTLREDAAARAYDESPPAAKIEVREAAPDAIARVMLTGAFEGEAVIFPPGSERETRVYWYRGRRALGVSPLGAPWPLWVAVEVPSLVPNRKRTQPEAGVALDEATDTVQRAVRAALEALWPEPPESVASVLLREARELGMARPTPPAVGRLWLTQEIAPTKLTVRTSRGAVAVDTETPVRGVVWWRAAIDGRDQWRTTVEEALRWGWHRMLEGLTEHADEASDRGAIARLHLAHALTQDELRHGKLKAWAQRARIVGSETTWANVRESAQDPQRCVAVVAPGDPRARMPRVLEARREPFFELLLSRGMLIDADVQARARSESAAQVREAREREEAERERAREAREREARAKASVVEAPPWRTGADALALLRGCGVSAEQLREIVAAESDRPVTVDCARARVSVGRRSVVVAGIEAQPAHRAAVMMATLVVSALGRGDGVRMDELAVMTKLLSRV